MSASSGAKVSVVIPVFNAEQTLRECLDGVTGQSLRELEIICVDDGSADGSPALLEEYRLRDSRIRVITQANRGAGAARNAGLDAATGEFLAFLDADDRFEPEMLALAYEACVRTGADLCVFGADSFDANTGETGDYPAALSRSLIPADNPFRPASDAARETVLQLSNGVPWNKLFRHAFIRETGLRFQALRTTNDAFFVYSALCRAETIAVLDRILVHRRKNGAASLTQTRAKSSLCFYEALLAIQDGLREAGIYECFERTFVNRALQNICWNIGTLPPDCAEQITGLMRQEGFRRLGIEGRDPAYFHDPRLYEKYARLCGITKAEPEKPRSGLLRFFRKTRS